MLKKLNEVMDYIEKHLTDDFLFEKVFEYVGGSHYHFKKIFFCLTNMTLNEYIKNRRLSEANKELLDGGKVTDIAFKYGYQSLDGFTRAFKKWSGFLPSEVFKKKESKVFPRFNFTITVKGGNSMECKIIEKQAFYFAGVSKRVPMQFEGINNEIVKLAQSITPEQRKEMHRLQNIEPYEIVNVSYESDTNFMKEEGELTHLIGVLTTEEEIGEQLEKLPVDAHTWAVFPNEGPFPFTLQNTMGRIYSEWFLTSGYELANSLSFSFTRIDDQKKDYAYSEIWIPVIRKANK